MRCFHCKNEGHIVKNCPEKGGNAGEENEGEQGEREEAGQPETRGAESGSVVSDTPAKEGSKAQDTMQASGSLNRDSNAEESVSESAGDEKPGSGLTDTNTGETSTLAAAAAASVSVEQKSSDQIEKGGVSAEPEMKTQVEKDELTETERDDKSLRMERSEQSSEFDSEEEGSLTDCSLTAEPPCTEAGYSVGSIKTFLELTKAGKPKPVLTREPAGEIFEGDTVTLSCVVEGSSDGWRYLWYKDRQYSTPVYQTNSSSGTGAGYTISAAALSHSGEYWCRAGRGSKPFNSQYSKGVKIQVSELPQTTLTLEPPFPEIFTGETVTLRCGVEGGSAGWKYLWYKDSEVTPVLQTAGCSITGDSYTITAAAVSDQGQYCCRGQKGDQPLYSQLSDPVKLNITDVHPKAVLTLQSAWAQIFTGDTVTLRCEVEGGSAGWRFKQYRDGHEEAWCSDQYSRRDGDSCTISYAQNSHSRVYWCESGQERSNAVTLSVSNEWVILQTPPQPVFEGDALTLKCRDRYNYHITKVVFYKDNKELQSQAGTELSVARVSKSDEGSFKCRAWWWSSFHYSEGYAEVRVSVGELFSWVTLTASPGATVKEGEALNLTCEAAVNKTPRPQLHYTIVRDGEPVTNSTDSALYSIASTEKSHTGSYTCAVESQGVKKSSQELHIEVQTSWHSAVAIGYRVSFTLIHFIVFTLLLLQYCRIQGSLCIAGGTSRKTSDQDQEQSAEGTELCSHVQHTGVSY
ncbi:Fc receptor-like protein 5 [Acipenser ruthenus]|uniref:Fc receptor-like protein 5 n=1 Tax=Acipenser ruthenus TaxID=7906 RepID=UPI002741D7E6|nr:Fc receptor-like protein 5 [Acipenser ruthenus]